MLLDGVKVPSFNKIKIIFFLIMKVAYTFDHAFLWSPIYLFIKPGIVDFIM